MNTYEYYRSIAIDLSKQNELKNPDLKQQINFIGKLEDDKASFFYHWEIRKNNFWIFTNFCMHYIKQKQKRS